MASDGEPRSSVHLLMQWDIFLTNKTAAPSEHLCNPLIIQADLFIMTKLIHDWEYEMG